MSVIGMNCRSKATKFSQRRHNSPGLWPMACEITRLVNFHIPPNPPNPISAASSFRQTPFYGIQNPHPLLYLFGHRLRIDFCMIFGQISAQFWNKTFDNIDVGALTRTKPYSRVLFHTFCFTSTNADISKTSKNR